MRLCVTASHKQRMHNAACGNYSARLQSFALGAIVRRLQVYELLDECKSNWLEQVGSEIY